MTDKSDQANEGAGASDDSQKQNPGGATTADRVDKHDRHKVEKLAKAGEPAVDPNIENPT